MTLTSNIEQRLEQAVKACQALALAPITLADDKQTDSFCRHYLTQHLTLTQLQQKVSQELGVKHWQPLGKLLLIISEKDILGTTLAFLAAYITGNKVIIKARESLMLLDFLKEHLALTDEDAQFIDWQGGEQDDVELLKQVNGIVLAGGDGLISYFRQVAPYPVRLIEFGPKLSAIAIGGELAEDDINTLTAQIIFEVTLFLQEVCSSPRFILVESKQLAEKLFNELAKSLAMLPALDYTSILAQSVKFNELKLLKYSQTSLWQVAFDAKTGWGVTLADKLMANLWFNKGFQLVVGSLDSHLKEANKHWSGALQTLAMKDYEAFVDYGFTRYCPLGTMHYRPLTAPHDGFFELSALVRFISREVS